MMHLANNIYVFVKIIFKKMDKNPRLFIKMEVDKSQVYDLLTIQQNNWIMTM